MAALVFAFLLGTQEVRLPVTPSSYRWGAKQTVNSVDVDGVGTVNLPGLRAAHSDQLDCMFPARAYPFCSPGAVLDPQYYTGFFKALVAERKAVRYIVGDRVNAQVLVEEFLYREQDGSGDVYATIYLREYVSLDAAVTETASGGNLTGNASRPADPAAETDGAQYYTVKRGDCLSVICRRFYGYGTARYYNAVAKYNGIKNPHLIYAGQKLTLPPPAQLGVT